MLSSCNATEAGRLRLRQTSTVGSPASCSLIIPMICASVKRLFLMRLLLPRGQTLHQNEGPFGGQVTGCGQALVLQPMDQVSIPRGWRNLPSYLSPSRPDNFLIDHKVATTVIAAAASLWSWNGITVSFTILPLDGGRDREAWQLVCLAEVGWGGFGGSLHHPFQLRLGSLRSPRLRILPPSRGKAKSSTRMGRRLSGTRSQASSTGCG